MGPAAELAPQRIDTTRLTLRCWATDDAPLVRAAIDASDEHLRPWIPFMRDEPRSLADTREWIAKHIAQFESGENFRYAMFDSNAALVGEVMLLGRAGPGAIEVGYWLHVDHCGHGYATEAASAVIDVARRHLGIERIEIQCATENLPSNRLPERLGFVLERVLDHASTGDPHDLNVWISPPAHGAQSPRLNPSR